MNRCSAFIEKLLKEATFRQIGRFLFNIQGFFGYLWTTPYGSHVLETVFRLLSLFMSDIIAEGDTDKREETNEDKEDIEVLANTNAENEQDEQDESPIALQTPSSIQRTIANMCNEVDGFWSNFMQHPCATHALRVFLGLISGCILPGRIDQSTDQELDMDGEKEEQESERRKGKRKDQRGMLVEDIDMQETQSDKISAKHLQPVPLLFQTILIAIEQDLLNASHLEELACDGYASPVLQFLLALSSRADKSQGKQATSEHEAVQASLPTTGQLLQSLSSSPEKKQGKTDNGPSIATPISSESFTHLCQDRVGSHFIQAALRHCEDSVFSKIYRKRFKGNILSLAEHSIANFVIQELLQDARELKHVKSMAKELSSSIEHLFSHGRAGVVWRLVEACAKHEVGQKKVMNGICQALNIDTESSSPELVMKLLTLGSPDFYGFDSCHFSTPGAMIISNLLKFKQKCIHPLLTSITNLNTRHILSIARSSQACRCVLEPIFESPSTSFEIKCQLYEKLQGHFSDLACLKSGSFVVEKCYSAMDVHRKHTIVTELSKAETKLAGSASGRFVLRVCKVHMFKRKKDQWEESEQKRGKVAQIFEEILKEPQSAPLPKPKKETQEKSSQKKKGKGAKMQDEKLDPFMAVLGFGKSDIISDKSKQESKENNIDVIDQLHDEKEKRPQKRKSESSAEEQKASKGKRKRMRKQIAKKESDGIKQDKDLQFVLDILSSRK